MEARVLDSELEEPMRLVVVLLSVLLSAFVSDLANFGR